MTEGEKVNKNSAKSPDQARKGGRGEKSLGSVSPIPVQGGTFAQNPVSMGGSTDDRLERPVMRGNRKGADDSLPDILVIPERIRTLASDGPVLGKPLGGGWYEVRSEGDPGSGFYDFDQAELPPMKFTPGNIFARDLEDARRILIMFLASRPAGTLPSDLPVFPKRHRPTRFCARARRARGENV